MTYTAGSDLATLALILGALALLISLSLALSRRRTASPRSTGAAAEEDRAPVRPVDDPDGELIAVIAAALVAASGMAPGGFRIEGIYAEGPSGAFCTPVWGHADRMARTSFEAR